MVNSKNDTNKLLLDSVVDYSMKNELIDEKDVWFIYICLLVEKLNIVK